MTTKHKSPPRGPAKKKVAGFGIVTSGESFTVSEFVKRLGITRMQLIRMRERGLVCRQDGRYVRILADDYLDYLANLPKAELKDVSNSEATETASVA